jgi:hypothetical protein
MLQQCAPTMTLGHADSLAPTKNATEDMDSEEIK